MSTNRGHEEGRALEALGLHADRALRGQSFAVRARAAFVRAAPWCLLPPVAALAVHGVQRWSGQGSFTISFPVLASLTLAPLVIGWIAQALPALFRDLDARAGLHRLDRELAAADRLETAHEFLARDAHGSFELAAIEDARAHVERARAHRIGASSHAALPVRAWLAPVAALVLAWLAGLVGPVASSVQDDTVGTEIASASTRPENKNKPENTDASKPKVPEVPREQREKKVGDAQNASRPEERKSEREAERSPRESTGKSGEGKSANASPSSQSSDSQGMPSSQSQPASSTDPAKPQTKKPKPKKPKDPAESSTKKLTQESGSTAGRGVGSGSSKNPGATDWASKDQVTNDEEPPLGDDEEVDDENSEEEARGGLQPNLRDRRPAVNRDLTIGFGNQPNPDANGRGGPSEQKKSRGVASLVLGVPIPDHVKGHPNPGRTKITQERVEPRSEDAASIQAATRSARDAAFGKVARAELEPWLRETVRGYFLSIHKQDKQAP